MRKRFQTVLTFVVATILAMSFSAEDRSNVISLIGVTVASASFVDWMKGNIVSASVGSLPVAKRLDAELGTQNPRIVSDPKGN